MSVASWNSLLRGEGCPFEVPRPESSEHWDKVASLSVSSLYLHRVQTYRGYCVLVFDPRHATLLPELSREEREAFVADLCRAQEAIERAVRPDHFNVESLGNQIPHLHWHIVPRFKNDPRWGLPIWMNTEAEMPRVYLSDTERVELLKAIRGHLS